MGKEKIIHRRPRKGQVSGHHTVVERMGKPQVVSAEVLLRSESQHPAARRVFELMEEGLAEIDGVLRVAAGNLLNEHAAEVMHINGGELPTENELVRILDRKIAQFEGHKLNEAIAEDGPEAPREYTNDPLKITAYQVICSFGERMRTQVESIIRTESEGVALQDVLEGILKIKLDSVKLKQHIYNECVFDSGEINDELLAFLNTFKDRGGEVYEVVMDQNVNEIVIDDEGRKVKLPRGSICLSDYKDVWEKQRGLELRFPWVMIEHLLGGYVWDKVKTYEEFTAELAKHLGIRVDADGIAIPLEFGDGRVIDRATAGVRKNLAKFFDGTPALRGGLTELRKELERCWMQDAYKPVKMFKPETIYNVKPEEVQKYAKKGRFGKFFHKPLHYYRRELKRLGANLQPHAAQIYKFHEMADHNHSFGLKHFIDAQTPRQIKRAWRLLALGCALAEFANQVAPDVDLHLQYNQVGDEAMLADLGDLVSMLDDLPVDLDTLDDIMNRVLEQHKAISEIERELE